MPLRDHFRPPVWTRSSWEGFHGMWPATMVTQLASVLPDEFTAEPRVHLGNYFEIDVCAYEGVESAPAEMRRGVAGTAVATVPWAPPEPTLTLDADLTEQY